MISKQVCAGRLGLLLGLEAPHLDPFCEKVSLKQGDGKILKPENDRGDIAFAFNGRLKSCTSINTKGHTVVLPDGHQDHFQLVLLV